MSMENKKLIVKEDKNLLRDSFSKAIINNDDTAYLKYLKRVSREQDKREEIEKLKSDVSEIKQMLTKLLERN